MSGFRHDAKLKDGQPGNFKGIALKLPRKTFVCAVGGGGGGGGTIIAAANRNGTSPRSLASIHDGAGIGPFGRS